MCPTRPDLPTHTCLSVQVWAVRENLCELALGVTATRLALPQYYGLTLFLVIVAYIISIAVPSESLPPPTLVAVCTQYVSNTLLSSLTDAR